MNFTKYTSLFYLLCLSFMVQASLAQMNSKDDKYATENTESSEFGYDDDDGSAVVLVILAAIVYMFWVVICAAFTIMIAYPVITSIMLASSCCWILIGYYYYNSFKWVIELKPRKILKPTQTGTKKFTGHFMQRDSVHQDKLKKVNTTSYITFKENGEISGTGTDSEAGFYKNFTFKINGTIHKDKNNDIILLYTKTYNDQNITSHPYHIVYFPEFCKDSKMSGCAGQYVLFDFINPFNFVFRHNVTLVSSPMD